MIASAWPYRNTPGDRSNFDRYVREQCEAIARSGVRESYHDFTRRLGMHYSEHQVLINAALTRIMKEDAKAGRPFASVAIVRGGGDGIPGIGFFTTAWELGRFRDEDEQAFVEAEWQALREMCDGQAVAA